jgi:hypothetical protein
VDTVPVTEGGPEVVEADLPTLAATDNNRLTQQTSEFDAGGRLDSREFVQFQSFTSQPGERFFTHAFEYSYEGREQYLETRVEGEQVGDASSGRFLAARTDSFYDANGNRIAVEERNEDPVSDTNPIRARYFDYSADNKLVKRTSGVQTDSLANADPNAAQRIAEQIGFEEDTVVFDDEGTEVSTTSHYLFSGNQYLGEITESGITRVREAHFAGVDVGNPEASQRYQVQEGDTLESLAVLFYGNADFWYVIATANGLDVEQNTLLTPGQSLDIPVQEQNQNRFDTFTSYNIAEQIGDTTPGLPFIPPAPEAGCNGIATIIIIAASAIIAPHVAALAGNGLLGAAAGAAAGNAGGQLAAIGLNQQEGFNLQSVAVSGITAGLTQGIANAIDGGLGNTFTGNTRIAELTSRQQAIVGAGRAVSAAVANKLVSGSSHFSFAQVAANAIAQPLVSRVNTELFGTDDTPGLLGEVNPSADAIGRGFVSGTINATTNRVLTGKGTVDFAAIALDSFGNVLGNSLARAETGTIEITGSNSGAGGVGTPDLDAIFDPTGSQFSPVEQFDPQQPI